MSELISEERCHCPFCAEPITIVVDYSAGSQVYIEDCQVCCQPMEIIVDVDTDGHRSVGVRCAS
ncbi:MAG TPA: CPXCG motif-containing cysteine-rich protein [Woeseiaceae bacterium]|nr:CPXCG motif-containing cysteine-rich protein [Woeseiaceae bacterium]